MKNYPFFFTWSAQSGAKPLNIVDGQGSTFTTKDGNQWLDMASLVYQVNAGHGNKRIINAIKEQADSLCITMPNANYPAKEELAKKLLSLAPPGFTKVFFTLGGAEANENALKIARMVSGRYKVLSRYRSYHGATLGALSLTGDYRRPPLEPALVGAIHAMDCYCDRCPFGQQKDSCNVECAHHIEQLMRLEGDRSIAAVFLEPIPGANGVLIPHKDYWKIVRKACDDQGAFLVADEVLTGFGRTGKWFGYQHFDVIPDMITVGKALTAGYGVLGAVLVHEKIAKHFDFNTLYAGLTNYAHPLGCAAALEALNVYDDEKIIEKAAQIAPFFQKLLLKLKKDFSTIAFVRSIGLLGAIEFKPDLNNEKWEEIIRKLQEKHILTHPYKSKKTIILSPPLIITEDELKDAFARIAFALTSL